jgi:SAM-dependent methyltransferase
MFQLLSAALGNDYRNARYLTHLKPALVGGRWLAKLVPTLTAGADLGYRYLPKPKPGRPPRVLDVGCGSGAWLQVARNAGWQAFGCEPDESSARLARLNGIEVRPFVSDWRDNLESFDAVTSSHSIEHVYDPAAMLLDAHRLLKSGGLLFVQTPNIDAVGHDLYGRYWRGLEAPRHLVLFNRDSLAELITRAGFVDVRLRRAPSALQLMALESRRMANGLDPRGNELPSLPPAPSVKDRVRSRYDTKKVEWLSFTARKAG